MIAIYVLAEPTGEIRYVGKTSGTLHRRYLAHLQVARGRPSTYVGRWVRTVLDRGEMPTISLLEEVPESDWAERERHWIKTLRQTCRLTNIGDGGEGGNTGMKMTDVSRRQMSASAKKRASDPVERVRLASISNGKPPPAARGEKNVSVRFTEAQVIEMRQRRGSGEKLESIAQSFGTSRTQVQFVVTGKTWTHVGGPIQVTKPKQRLTVEQVREIRSLVLAGVPQGVVARQFGIHPSHVSKIVSLQRNRCEPNKEN